MLGSDIYGGLVSWKLVGKACRLETKGRVKTVC